MTSTPFATENHFALLSTDDDDNQGSQQPFSVVRSRNKRRQRSSSQPQEQQQQQQQQSSTSSGDQQRPPTQVRRAPTVFGKSTRSAITAAKKLRKKRIFCIDNVTISCTSDDMKIFISSLSVEVISCFETKPRRRPHESAESVHDRKAFRVCINEDDCQRFLNPSVWPDSISVSEWYSKQ